MSEMVERVARAMCRQHNLDGFGLDITEDDHITRYVNNTVDKEWPKWSREARAAIEAMREPTDAMLDAACDGLVDPDGNPVDVDCSFRADLRADAKTEWQDVIDAALK